jgi:hypothetical protein
MAYELGECTKNKLSYYLKDAVHAASLVSEDILFQTDEEIRNGLQREFSDDYIVEMIDVQRSNKDLIEDYLRSAGAGPGAYENLTEDNDFMYYDIELKLVKKE